MKILAIIPARGGSKRLPRKNVKLLGDKPLINWSIESVQGIGEIIDILISTDDMEIAAVAKNAHALVPWLRPSHLATDTASSVDVCLHALEWYEKEKSSVDAILLLQPTSPFRTKKKILEGVQLFIKERKNIIGFSQTHHHPDWCFKLENGLMKPFIENGNLNRRSQDLIPAYVINGAFYLIDAKLFKKTKSFYEGPIAPLLFSLPEESIDIDTEDDWRLAESYVSKKS